MNDNYLVFVDCPTYNHSLFIENALDGFCMQKTSFPFLCGIVDDASTDGSQDIIFNYVKKNFELNNPEGTQVDETDDYKRIFSRHQINKNCFFVVFLLKNNQFQNNKTRFPYIKEFMDRSRYIAVCEGDDCWTVSYKMQKQVDFLESHGNVNICVHNATKFICSSNESIPFNRDLPSRVYDIREVIQMKWFTPTASFLYRNNYELSPVWKKNGCNGDMAALFSNLLIGDLYYDSEIMSIYRYGTPSSLSTVSNDRVLYHKKLNMYKTLDAVSDYKYHKYILKEIFKLKVYNCHVFRALNSLRIRIREKLMG